MAQLTVAGRTEVIIGRGIPATVLPQRPGRSRVAILTQPAATDIAVDVASRLKEQGLTCEVVGLPDRDEAKTLDVAASVYETLARFGLARRDTVIGVGGGAVTDLAGFVAGTWLRGVEAVQIPTTLVGAVDASIGGKTGVNVGGKNLVGVFWHPSRVIIDLDLLALLPSFLAREGMAEAYKTGLIGDPELAAMIGEKGMRTSLREVVERSVAVKARVVGQDEREEGIRAHLNFGHTIGHGVEYASSLSHGDSVGLGMVAAAHISERLVGFRRAGEVTNTVEKLELPTEATGIDSARVMDLIGRDKKRDAEGIRMVLLSDIGEPVVAHVEHEDLRAGLAAIGL
ncbi:MAG: 3-dehydroquinate synthase [Acidimicrobiia bacterium]|jgi:3-dehydroquinate synthase